VFGDLLRVHIAAHGDGRLVAAADARRVGGVELGFRANGSSAWSDRAGADCVDADPLPGDFASGRSWLRPITACFEAT